MKPIGFPLGALALLLAACSAPPVAGGMTEAQGEAILAELKDIKRMLADERRKPAEPEPAPPPTARLEGPVVNALGDAGAPVTLVEFTDYQCPFCKRFHDRSWPELKRRYVDTGQVRLVVRDMPLPFHAAAMPAAIAARCAGEQGRFAEAFEALFSAPALTPESVNGIVLGTGIAPGPFEQCTRKAAVRAAIDADVAEAERIGVSGTPGFVVARMSGGRLEGEVVVGAQPTTVFSAKLDALLGAPRAH